MSKVLSTHRDYAAEADVIRHLIQQHVLVADAAGAGVDDAERCPFAFEALLSGIGEARP
ncbi:hypothetical protein ACFYWY_11975 [Streptomyces sp. NPDC002870]|uniref:hypothetical protein n=1 Tax=Streptomyces sp. NPDC002870 TaxID=3364666 RepID=UPI00367B98AF